jgi:hypothetical protein
MSSAEKQNGNSRQQIVRGLLLRVGIWNSVRKAFNHQSME